MNKTISRKLFAITFGLIISIVLSSLVFQTLFFDEYYLHTKSNDLIKEIDKFKELYSYEIYNDKILTDALSRFEQENSSRIAIFSTNGELSYLANSNKGIDDLRTLTAFCSELLNDKKLIYDVLKSDKTKSTIFENKSSGLKNIGIISPMSLRFKNDSIIISVSSIQPIHEASNVIKSFYKYLFLGFIIIGIFLSFIYANLISKPLIKLNKTAKKMSALDFSTKCEIESEDEIGDLANTLNFLSSNLNNALEDLKHKNQRLEKDIEKERKLEKMRKDFVAGVSHELKTPIGIIEGYAEGLKDGIATGKDAEVYLNIIIDESHKMSRLVTNMLELSKLESGSITLNLENFNIIRLIKKIINNLSMEFDTKGIDIILQTDIEYAYVEGDIFQLDQVLTNLLTNALKYTPSKEKVIISIGEEFDLFLISVENKGAQIPESEIENIYTKFYRVDKSRSRTKESTGLGLAIVKNILTLHNSTYSIANTSDGVKFTFTLKKSSKDNYM